jgi:drug/metabolite transporter (DMT)-like permease
MYPKNQSKAYVYALLTVLCWSTVATAFKIALRDLNYIQVLLLTNFISLLVYTGILIFRGSHHVIHPPTLKEVGLSSLQGLLNPFAYYLIIFRVYSLLPAQIAQPVNFIWPVVLTVLSAPLLKQRLRMTSLLALLVSFSGVMILSSQGNLADFRIQEPVGVALAMSSSLIWSVFWIINLRDSRDDILKLFSSSAFSMAYILILALVTGNIVPVFSKPILPAVYIGLFETGITFVLWLKALQLSESTGRISNLIYLTPFVSLIFIHFILGEQLYYTSLLGLCLIIGGIFIQRIKYPAV